MVAREECQQVAQSSLSHWPRAKDQHVMHPAQEAWNFACPNEQVLFVELRIKTDVGAIESDHAGALLDVDELFAEPKNDEVLSLDALLEPVPQAHPGKVVGEALGRHAANLPVDPRL